MKSLKLELGERSYDILIGSGLLDRAAELLTNAVPAKNYIVITNPTVEKLYGNKLKENLSNRGFIVNLLTIPDGEEYKSLDTAGRLYEELTGCFAERDTPLLALGGGVIGDLAGFVASTYMRGVPLVQIPTTLLAQVDSSIGGKVAVDHGNIKNKIGTFYQPGLVISDTAALKTLPQAEFINGMAEVIKSAVIRDNTLFVFIKENLDAIMKLDNDVIEEMVFRTAAIKAAIVAQDERDTGLRNILNFGHTIGHAVETVSGFRIPHGQAVAIGMLAEAGISHKMGTFEETELEELENLILHCGLPVKMPEFDKNSVMKAMSHDKKTKDGKIRFALPRNIGDVYLTDEVDIDCIREALES
jgi:3-dehydroquinate synthase